MPRRPSDTQHEFGFMRNESDGSEPPPHTDADYVPSPGADAPIDFTEEERDILVKLIGDSGARPMTKREPRRARSRVERAIDQAAKHAWHAAMVAAGKEGNWDEATRIARLGPEAFRGAEPREPFLPGAV